jgi:ABC-type cobalamin/Fe3+-siderophores transport system ATPase subunit
MGEAKRRKQQLGQAYGKKHPPLNNQTLREMHGERFIKDAIVAVDQLIAQKLENPEETTIREYIETTQEELISEFRTWLDKNLASYEPKDREFLASTYADISLAAFEEASDYQKSNMVFSLAIVCEATKLYLDEETTEAVVAFQESLAELFEMLIAEEEGETAANEA